jgi:hypothetical protein
MIEHVLGVIMYLWQLRPSFRYQYGRCLAVGVLLELILHVDILVYDPCLRGLPKVQ